MEAVSPSYQGEHLPPHTKSFDEQINERERIPVLDGFVETLDIRPEHMTDEVPVLIVPGWMETIELYRNGIKEMLKQGRRVIALEHPRHGVNAPHIKDEGDRQSEAGFAVIEAKKEEKYDIVGHSQGAAVALMNAAKNPDRVRNIVLVNPAGLIGKDSFYNLALRFGKMLIDDQKRSHSPMRDKTERRAFAKESKRTATESVKSILKNPKRALLSEVSYLINCDATDILQSLIENGIGVTVIANHDDPVFPEVRLRKTLKDHDLFQFYTLSGGHNLMTVRPEKYMHQVTSALERMKVAQEIGLDEVNVIGDKLVLKNPPEAVEDSEEVKQIRESLGIRKIQ